MPDNDWIKELKPGDRAIFNGKDIWMCDDFNLRYGGDKCTVLVVRGNPFDDCQVAFDSFPKCNRRDDKNWFFVPTDCLTLIDEKEQPKE